MKATTVHLEELPYTPDSGALFDRVRHLPGALMLDSCYPHTRAGRFDIIAADPAVEISFNCSGSTSYDDIVKCFQEMGRAHSEHCDGLAAPAEELPFWGGLAGYLDYGIGKPLQHLPPEPGASAAVNLYNWALVQDHLLQRCTFAALPSLGPAARSEVLDRLRDPHPSPAGVAGQFRLLGGFSSNLDRDSYREAFQQIQRYILSGDCYQVNLAQRFTATCEGDPWQAYLGLRALAAAPFCGFMTPSPTLQLLCLSPERFLRVGGRHVETRPIKGTRPRQQDRLADQLAAEELRLSPKDRAENLMIVDLLRNDIGRNCAPGSIRVDRLFELESYPAVHHLVSTISGELVPGRGALDLLRDSFPGGSITGAPKRRAMQIIEELEPDRRQAYCGSLFYLGADGRFDSNIMIRSLVCEGGSLHCWGGGGIVADSRWELEYQETWDKVGRFLEWLECRAGETVRT